MTSIIEPTSGSEVRHAVKFTLENVEWRQAENGRSDDYTLRGHAAVFNKLSDDLGGFRELLEPGAFRAALRGSPDVRLLIDHQGLPLARTASGTLELREDSVGLHVWARVAPSERTTELRSAMQRGDVDQMSFAFTLHDGEGADDWAVTDTGSVVRTIRADGVADLYDVSVVTFPAYPQTDAGMRDLRTAVDLGRLPASVLGEPDPTESPAPVIERVAADVSRSDNAGDMFTARREALGRAVRRHQLGMKGTRT